MLPHEIFSKMPPEIAAQLFSYLFEKEKALYKASIEALAKQRNVRPVFVERKPRDERFAWLHAALSRHAGNSVAAHLLQIWLIGAQSKLLCDFLDGLGIAHDENGTVQDLPPAPSREQLLPAIEGVLAKHDPVVVSIYLHAFQALDDEGGWPSLAELLESDPRFRLGEAASA